MPGSTYTEWLGSMYSAYAEHVTERGADDAQQLYQFAPYYLAATRSHIYNELRGTDHDCYHNGELFSWLTQVRLLWDRPKTFGVDVHVSLIEKLATQVEYSEGPRYSIEHDWLAEVSGYDSHGQERLSDDEEDLLRQIKGYPR